MFFACVACQIGEFCELTVIHGSVRLLGFLWLREECA